MQADRRRMESLRLGAAVQRAKRRIPRDQRATDLQGWTALWGSHLLLASGNRGSRLADAGGHSGSANHRHLCALRILPRTRHDAGMLNRRRTVCAVHQRTDGRRAQRRLAYDQLPSGKPFRRGVGADHLSLAHQQKDRACGEEGGHADRPPGRARDGGRRSRRDGRLQAQRGKAAPLHGDRLSRGAQASDRGGPGNGRGQAQTWSQRRREGTPQRADGDSSAIASAASRSD